MKQCPECKEVYSDQLSYCLKDGKPLFSIDADDDGPETVVRPKPIFVDIEDHTPVSEPDDVQPIIISDGSRGRRVNVVAVLLVGTLIGGILVLGTVLALNILNRDKPAVPAAQVNVPPKPSNTPKPTPKQTEPPANTNTPANDDTNTDSENADEDDQQKRERWIRKGFNGRVIMINAVVRAAPSIDSDELAVIGYDEPVKIGKPAGDNNPWFRVTTADGLTGWMHGNTIEFIK